MLCNAVLIGVVVNDLGTRMSISLTLLLTLVALKFVMMLDVPRILYLTYLDLDIMAGFAVLTFGAIWNGVILVLYGGTPSLGFGDTPSNDDVTVANNLYY